MLGAGHVGQEISDQGSPELLRSFEVALPARDPLEKGVRVNIRDFVGFDPAGESLSDPKEYRGVGR